MFLEVEEGMQDQERRSIIYLIRFIADLLPGIWDA